MSAERPNYFDILIRAEAEAWRWHLGLAIAAMVLGVGVIVGGPFVSPAGANRLVQLGGVVVGLISAKPFSDLIGTRKRLTTYRQLQVVSKTADPSEYERLMAFALAQMEGKG